MNVRTRAVKITAAVTLSLAALGVGSLSPAGAADGDASRRGRSQVTTPAGDGSVVGDPGQWETRKVNEYEGQHRKVNEYEGQKVNEYEGQHR